MKSAKNSKKIVVKVGSSVLTTGTTQLKIDNLKRIVKHVADLQSQKNQVVLVTSGAISCGLSHMGINKRPAKLCDLQAAASIGQNILMQTYTEHFNKCGLKCAQILMTRDDFYERKRYINAKNTIDSLFNLGVVPIVNENDTVSVDEIRFGDNDMLSALVSMLINADGLEILSNIEGLCKKYDKQQKAYSELIKKVKKITPDIEIFADGTDSAACIGGMESKIEAIKIATSVGIPVVLANGLKEGLNINFDSPDECDGTYFEAASKSNASKKQWIAFGSKSKGKIVIDDGAKKALVTKTASLLAQGVTEVTGEFIVKDTIDIVDKEGAVLARGITRFSSQQLEKTKGKKADKEVVHRNDLVLLV